MESSFICKSILKGNNMNITYTQVKNPAWGNPEHTSIICEVNFEHLGEEFVPFSAVASGDYPHTHEIYARCLAGEFGEIAEYSAPIGDGVAIPFQPTQAQPITTGITQA
jgi:hypothetical protein